MKGNHCYCRLANSQTAYGFLMHVAAIVVLAVAVVVNVLHPPRARSDCRLAECTFRVVISWIFSFDFSTTAHTRLNVSHPFQHPTRLPHTAIKERFFAHSTNRTRFAWQFFIRPFSLRITQSPICLIRRRAF